MALLVAGATSAVAAMPAVHEQVEKRAEKEQRVRERPENVRLVFFPEEEQRDRSKKAEPQHPRDVEGLSLGWCFGFGLHVQVSFHTSDRLRRSALPTTETELRLIAAAAMMGESSNPKNG